MATPVFICGFECNALVTGAAGTGHWDTLGAGTPTIQSTYARNSGLALRCNPSAAQEWIQYDASAVSPTTIVYRFYLYLVSAPAADVGRFAITSTNGGYYYALGWTQSTGKLKLGQIGGTSVDGPVITSGVWYAIDIKAVCSGSTHTIDWKVDGAAQTQYTNAAAADTWNNIRVGTGGSNQTYDACYDDFVVSYTAADFPLTQTAVVGYRVGDTSGTHNQTAGDLKEHGGSNLSNGDSTGSDLNETTFPDTASYVYQGTARSTTYAEYIYATSAAPAAPIGVEQIVAIIGSAAGTNTQKAQLHDGTSAADMYSLATTSDSLTFQRKCWATAPSTGAWTLAKLQAARIRWGFSDDVSPVPRLSWTILEAAFESLGVTGTGAVTAGLPTISGTGTTTIVGTGAFTAGLPTISGTNVVPPEPYRWTPGYPSAVHLRANWERRLPFERQVLALAPVGYWRFGEGASTAICYDRAGGNHGTYAGTYLLAQESGIAEDTDTCVTFDGTSGYATIPDAAALDVGDTFSIVGRIRRTTTGIEGLLGKGANAPALAFDADDYLTLSKSGVGAIAAATVAVTDDTTFHTIGVVKSAGTATRLYVDGCECTGSVTDRTCASTADALTIGYDGSAYFDGSCDEWALFSTALTSADMAALHAAATHGEFGGALCDLTGRWSLIEVTRGRNADFSGDATGTLGVTVDNDDGWFTQDRNLATDASFEGGVAAWSTAALTGITSAATSLEWTTDAASGSYAGKLTLPATSGAGAYQSLRGRFRYAVPYTAEVALKKISGTANIVVGLASGGTATNLAVSTGTITDAWARYSVTWYPSASCTDAVLFVRSTSADAVVVEIDAVQINAGTTPSTYQEAPVSWQLRSGAPVHLYATYDSTDYPIAVGRVQRITPIPGIRSTARITCYDWLSILGDTLVDVDSADGRTHRTYRAEIIDAAVRSLESGHHNLVANGSFETSTDGWTATAGAISASTTIAQFGAKSLRIVGSGAVVGVATYADTTQVVKAGRVYCLSFHAAAYGNTTQAAASIGTGETVTTSHLKYAPGEWVEIPNPGGGTSRVPGAPVQSGTYTVSSVVRNNARTHRTGTGAWPALTAAMQRYSYLWLCLTDGYLNFALSAVDGTAATDGIYVDGVMVTEGPTLHDYIDHGAPISRQPNMLSNGSFTTDRLPWDVGYSNRCGNPSGDGSGTGWSADADGFHDAGAVFGDLGAGSGFSVAMEGNPNYEGCHYALAGTFRSGRTYRASVTIGTVTDGGLGLSGRFGLGSTGTPADKATPAALTTSSAGTTLTVTWTPTGDRTDAHVYFRRYDSGGTLTVTFSHVTVVPYNFSVPDAVDDGISGLDEPDTYTRVADALSPTGYACEVVPFAAAGSGVYSTIGSGTNVAGRSGVPYTASVWVWCASGTASVTIGAGSPATPADNNSTTITATTTPVRYSIPWVPSGNRTDGIMWLAAGAAAADAFRFSAVSFTLGRGVQDYRPPQCDGLDDTETDIAPTTELARASALGSLQAVNAATMSHHWIEATMAPPWWRYHSAARGRTQSLAVSQVYDGESEDLTLSGIEDDIESVVNECTVAHAAAQGYQPEVGLVNAQASAVVASDLTSQLRSGSVRPRALGSTTLVNAPVPHTDPDTSAQEIADDVIVRYRDGQPRPVLTVTDRMPDILERQPEDLIAVTLGRAHWYARPLVACSLIDTITPVRWVQEIRTEGHAY